MNEVIDAEQWCPITGHEGLYSISDQGHVRSEPKMVVRRNGVRCNQPQRVLKPSSGKSEYRTVRLLKAGGGYRTHYVHTLVAEHFISVRPKGFEVCHKDGVRAHNAASNLRWDTRAGNHADKKLHGTDPAGERHPMAKLDDKSVMAIRARRTAGATFAALSAEFNVSNMTAYRAAKGISWSHL